VEIDVDDDRDASTVMQEVFRERWALLIFDNADAAAIRELLPGGTRCAVLITTRDRGLPAALGVPETARLDLSPLPPADALALLEQLIGARVPADGDAANRICELVGYLPLALQIAGATLQLQPWRALVDYADALAEERKRLTMLAFHDLDVRVSFSLSLHLLDSSAIDFFASLAICAQDGFSLMGAAAANGCDESTAQDRLTQLYSLSLVNDSSGDTPRFVLHPLLRLFAREKAEERGVLAVAETRHRDFYSALVKTKTRDTTDADAAALLGREIDDIVAAAQSVAREGVLDYDFVLHLGTAFERLGHWHKLSPVLGAFIDLAKRSQDWSAAVQLELRQAKFLTLRGRFAEAEQLLLALEVVISHIESEDARRRATAMLLNSLGGVFQRLGRFDDAVSALQRSAAIEEQLGNSRGLSKVFNSLGGVLQRRGAFDKAAEMFRRSAAIDQQSENRRGEAMTLNSLGGVLQRQGDFKGAVDAFRRSEDLLTTLGDLRGQAMVLTSLGGVQQRQGDFAGAIEVLKRSAAIESRLGNDRGQAIVLNSLGGVLQRQGKFDQAVNAFSESYELEKNLENLRGQAMVLNSLGGVLQRQGKFDQAADAFRRSHTISEKLDDKRSVAMVLNSLGGVLQRQGKFDQAVDAFRRSYDLLVDLDDVRGQAMVLNSLGGVLQRQGRFDQAVNAFRESYELEKNLENLRGQAMVLNSLGGVLQRQGKFDEAADAFRRSHTISQKLDDKRSVAMVLNSLGGVFQRQGKFAEAVDRLRRSYELLVDLGDFRGQAMVLNSLGGVLHRQQKPDEAYDAFRASIAIGEKLNDKRHLAMVHTAYGLALLKSDREAAVRELRIGFEFDAALRNRRGVGMVASILVETLIKMGRSAEALEICQRALAIAPGDQRLLRLKADLDAL
jgi:tetratricopeptide (TPR) repeat protein